MPNELAISVSLNFNKSGRTLSRADSKAFTVAGTRFIENVQTVGTVAEAIQLGDIAAPGYIYAKNLDATNYVDVSPDGIAPTIRLNPGQFALFPAAGTLQAKANTAACDVLFAIIEA